MITLDDAIRVVSAVIAMGMLISIALPLILYGVQTSGDRPWIAAICVMIGVLLVMAIAFPILVLIGIELPKSW